MATQISAYTYGNRLLQYDMPYEASIRSMRDVCVPTGGSVTVLTDPRFKDGTLDALHALASTYRPGEVLVVPFEWRLDEPGCDGLAKAEAREWAAKTGAEVLLPFDLDEVMPEDRIKQCHAVAEEMVGRRWPVTVCGTLNWFNAGPSLGHIKYCEPLSKPRFTLNDSNMTHGIPLSHRRKTWTSPGGESHEILHALRGTDGAGLIWKDSGRNVESSHAICDPLTIRSGDEEQCEADLARYSLSLQNPDHIHVHHFSWADVARKWSMDQTWWYLWRHLYMDDYPCGLDDYTYFKEERTPIDFWSVEDFRRPADTYKAPITNEMAHPAVVKLSWVDYPQHVQAWMESKERIYYHGEHGHGKRAELPRPPRFRSVRKLWGRLLPQYEFD